MECNISCISEPVTKFVYCWLLIKLEDEILERKAIINCHGYKLKLGACIHQIQYWAFVKLRFTWISIYKYCILIVFNKNAQCLIVHNTKYLDPFLELCQSLCKSKYFSDNNSFDTLLYIWDINMNTEILIKF